MCPPVPVKVAVSIPLITKLKKLALNYRGIPRPPELGYKVTYPIPTLEDMQIKFKIEQQKLKEQN
jgi:hypothetical protein